MHNLALNYRMPAPIPEREEDEDGRRDGNAHMLEQPPPHQALAAIRREVLLRRQVYIENYF